MIYALEYDTGKKYNKFLHHILPLPGERHCRYLVPPVGDDQEGFMCLITTRFNNGSTLNKHYKDKHTCQVDKNPSGGAPPTEALAEASSMITTQTGITTPLGTNRTSRQHLATTSSDRIPGA
ncbi:Uu.00g134290.m01.CDS01 [Anthostomella pinea]|uniref:Uu.00g134290.m01.CDS01 n=1 Tax=Anthostomella pinea TaxID=933095 RepID=A0AAI8YKX7_9PEZI|nr:Uu.00g134290.m01.CDS01 [Anthostomella pinea]